LGPGQYNLDKVEAFPVYKFKPSSMFCSKVERVNYAKESKKAKHGRSGSVMETLKSAMKPAIEESDTDSDSDNGVPGPGSYNTMMMNSDFQVNPAPERLQFFGSTVTKRSFTTGPGMYDPKPAKAHIHKGKPIPFACSDKRFRKKKIDKTPGPGEYKQATLISDLSNKPWGKKGIFGSSE